MTETPNSTESLLNYETLPRNSEAVVYVAMIHLMVRRLARHPVTSPP
jgi:hypothetical protein